MSTTYKFVVVAVCLLLTTALFSQSSFKGQTVDAITKEPLAGVSIHCLSDHCTCGCASNSLGHFEMSTRKNCCTSFIVSSVGYESVVINAGHAQPIIYLNQVSTGMETVVVTANREAVKRSLAPVAINLISSKTIQDTKPPTIDQVLNKVSGVYMVNLGNEQHSMSIRQPMTTRSLFLYLEDGIPIRTTGLFNHNALLEINMAAIRNIEVIKGPSSSLYGSEAIGGVVNFITQAPTAVPTLKLSLQGNDIGYKRTDLQTAFTSGKWGFAVSGYYAQKKNSFIEFTDFHKATFTARVDYHFSEKTSLVNTLTWMHYYSDMTGGIDSTRFADRSFGSNQTFTYRKVDAVRYRSTLNHTWNENSKSSLSLVFRDNTIGQNPAYGIKDDYRRLSNGSWTGKKDLAHGEINVASFQSYALLLQHRQQLAWKNAVIVGGASIDLSPSSYSAEYIRIKKDTLANKYTSFQKRDSILTNYRNEINNYAVFGNFEFSPLSKLRIVASLRYDLFRYRFNNSLTPSAYSGSPDTSNSFQKISPKIGFTYNFSSTAGVYANYSQGFVPPQVTEMYKGVKVPELVPSVFYNYEIGGWVEPVKGKLSADVSAYRLSGTHEIISVRMDDGSAQNMNAGKTMHKGIEAGITGNPVKEVSIRFSSALSEHRFVNFVEKGTSYNNNEMNGAPRWMHNAEVWYRPAFVKGLRVGIEWQKIGNYFMDPLNTVKYGGYNVFHLRSGYRWNSFEVWVNVLNVTDKYYAYTSSKSNSGYSYTPGDPRNFNMGISYDFGEFIKEK